MKPLQLLILLAALVFASCTALSNSPLLGSAGAVVNAAAGGKLTPVQDPATGLYGYVNDFGAWAIPPRYQSASAFNDAGIAGVRVGGRYGAINRLNQFVIQPNISDWAISQNVIRSLSNGRLPGIDLWIEKDSATGLYGFLNNRGEWAIRPQYVGGYTFNDDGFAVVSPSKKRWGVINRSNQFVIQPSFETSYDAEAALRRLSGR